MTILQIDRSKPFDPVGAFGSGWSILEEDSRSLLLTEIDLSKVSFQTMLKHDELMGIDSEELLKRLKANGSIRLDAGIFQTIYENQELIPRFWRELAEDWIEKESPFIFADGTVLQKSGCSATLYMFCRNGFWHLQYAWSVIPRQHFCLSAVLAS